MITEDYVSFETAKLLKDKGFDEPCLYYYFSDGRIGKRKGLKDRNCSSVNTFSMPTLQMAMKWLREKHLLHIPIDMMNGGRWEYEIDDIGVPFDGGVLPKYYCDKTFSIYEEAVEDAIKYCLENLIK